LAPLAGGTGWAVLGMLMSVVLSGGLEG